MYNDTIYATNKIITDKDLMDIFELMNEKLIHLQKIYQAEERQNRMLQYSYQKWTFRESRCELSFDVKFSDNTNIKFDNYNNFIAIFNTRLHEIKTIFVYFYISYSVVNQDSKTEWYNQYIRMYLYEDDIRIDVSLSSVDKKIDDVYELIKAKILNAPIKYDTVIKNKDFINTIVGLAIGFIPSLTITTLLLFVPTIRYIFAISYVLYPICCIILAFVIGCTISSVKLEHLYKTIKPEQKYVGYDKTNHKGIYKYNIDKYTQTSEVLIGKNVNNMKNRESIMNYYSKYKKYIPYEIGIMILFSIIILFFR